MMTNRRSAGPAMTGCAALTPGNKFVPPEVDTLTVCEPVVTSTTRNDVEPLIKGRSVGSVSPGSAVTIWITADALGLMLKVLSTPFTVTRIGVPATIADGAPVLPVLEPGTAVSPGSNTCSFVAD